MSNRSNLNKNVTVFLFNTSWGWCGAWVSPEGVREFQLPVRDRQRARELMEERIRKISRSAGSKIPLALAEFDQTVASKEIAALTGSKIAGGLVAQVRDYFEGRRRSFDLPARLGWAHGVSAQDVGRIVRRSSRRKNLLRRTGGANGFAARRAGRGACDGHEPDPADRAVPPAWSAPTAGCAASRPMAEFPSSNDC